MNSETKQIRFAEELETSTKSWEFCLAVWSEGSYKHLARTFEIGLEFQHRLPEEKQEKKKSSLFSWSLMPSKH